MNKKAPIGVMDSGVGGLSVLRCLRQLLPQEDFIYLGDTARTPYGSRSEGELRQFTEEIMTWLEGQGVKQVVLSCNTTTSLGIASLQRQHPFHIIGMSRGEQQLLAASSTKKIGILATPFTIGTGAHAKAIGAIDPSAQVIGVPCTDFVALIEGEQFHTPALKAAIKEYCSALKNAQVDTALLGCTHYPFIEAELQEELGDKVKLVDPAMATALASIADLKAQNLLNSEGEGKLHICCTADLPRVRRLTGKMLPVDQCDFQEISLAKAAVMQDF